METKTYVLTYTITITADGTDEEQAENNGWEQLENLLAVAPSTRDFSCHNYGATE
jgi:hypothetical protein